MNLDNHPFLVMYLVGALAGCVASIVVSIESYAVSWFFKGNILRRNLWKIQDPAQSTFGARAAAFCVFLLVNTALSWFTVLITIVQLFTVPLSAIREAVASVPEEVKRLRYPLMTNPDLSGESVWAYLTAWNTKLGRTPVADTLESELFDIERHHPLFQSRKAVAVLASLNVIDPQVLNDVSKILKEREVKQAPFTSHS